MRTRLNSITLQFATFVLVSLASPLFAVDPPPIYHPDGAPPLNASFFEGKTPPERIKIANNKNYESDPDFFVLSNACPIWGKYSVPGGFNRKALRDIRKGDYDSAIRELQETLQYFSNWWEERSGYETRFPSASPALKIPCNLFLLATAYELKGDWGNMLNAFAIAYGEYSDEYMWAQLRAMYASTPEYRGTGMLVLLTLLSKRLSAYSLDDVLQKVETSDAPFPLDIYMRYNNWDPDPAWVAFYTFYDYCARVVCPEMYYVSSYSSKPNENNFFELQKKSFDKFVDAIEKQYQELPTDPKIHERSTQRGHAQTIELLRKLRERSVAPRINRAAE